MKKYTWIIVGIIIVVGVITLAVTKPEKTAGQPIKIGAVLSLTGFAAPWGEYAKNGIELAVKDINSKGGIEGRTVEVVFVDDHTEGKDAVSAYTKLVSLDRVDGVIGGVFDFVAQPLVPLALTNNKPFISGSNFRIEGGFELNDQSFVMLSDFKKVIRQLKTYIAGEKITQLAVVHFKSSFGNEIAKTLDAVMKEQGGTGIINEEYAAIGDNNFRTTIAKLKAQNIDAVFLDMVGNDPVNFLVQAKQLGFAPKIISYNGIADSFAGETDKSLLEGVTILNWEVSSPQFIAMYKTAHGIEPTKSADKYFDAVYVMAEAIARSEDVSKAHEYIEKNSFTTPNSTITFTADHAVENVATEIQVIRGGVATKYVGR